MKTLRRKFILRTFCITAALLILNSVVYPTISYAVTTGPHQPEFTSYESAGATDMVNLATGDFTFNLPVLSIPAGTDETFTVPLSYHSGIGPDQEASWVGLGWNINVGSITRTINGFPDDANGEPQVVNVKDLTGTRGWTSNILGAQIGWDSEVGHYGSINFIIGNVNYANGKITSVGLMGLNIGGGKVSFSAAQFAMIVVQTAMKYAMMGVAEAVIPGMGMAMGVGSSGKIIADAMNSDNSPTVGTEAYWKYKKRTERRWFHTNYWITLNQTRTEDMYGVLNLHNANQNSDAGSTYADHDYFVKIRNQINGTASTPVRRFIKSSSTANKGSASDVNMNLDETSAYKDNKSASVLAYDNFNVNGPDISGSIKPYRMEIGSVSAPREMTSKHIRLNPIQYMDYGSNKVPFVYEGMNSNRYYHHVGASSAVSAPDFYFGIASTKVNVGAPSLKNPQALRYDLNDVIFSTQRLRTDVNTTKKIPMANHVEWLTNLEIKNTTGKFNNAYIDYFDGGVGGPRQAFRTNYNFAGSKYFFGQSASGGTINVASPPAPLTSFIFPGDTVDISVITYGEPDEFGNQPQTYVDYPNKIVETVGSNTVKITTSLNVTADPNRYITITTQRAYKNDEIIGAYVITGADGMNYHYSIAVYDYNFVSKTVDKSDAGKNSTITRGGQFANTWLLTAITGPDFVDRGGANNAGNGTIDENDWGYWVKFNYGLNTASSAWRIPFTGDIRDSENKTNSNVSGIKEEYFLNSIETRSHVALFIKDTRRDGKASNGTKSLRLSEIALLTKEAYNELIDPAGAYQLAKASGTINCMYFKGSPDHNYTNTDNVTGTKATYIEANALKRIVFNTDYTLCNGVPNSDSGYGKLTLNSISFLGKNNAKIFPDYKFGYTHNPNYSIDKWDGWGMYNSAATSSYNTHTASNIDADGWAWTMNSIKSPDGNEIVIDYERDDYSSISGVVGFNPYSIIPTDQYLSDLTTNVPAGQFSNGERVSVIRTEYYSCPDEFGGTSINTVASHTIGGTVQGTTVTIDYPFPNPNAQYFTCEYGGGTYTYFEVTVQKLGAHKKGGNVRVKAITIKDDLNGIQNKSRYIYTQDTQPWTTSSGVVSVEPDYVRIGNQAFYDWIGYPNTPVMYGKVAVLTGKLTNDNDYVTKQVYEFETPHRDMFSMVKDVVKDKVLFNTHTYMFVDFKDYRTEVKNQITRRTSKIGKLKSIKTFDNLGVNQASQEMMYTETPLNDGVNNYQGVYTEGSLLFEIIEIDQNRYHKANRTTVVNYPYTLKRVVTTENGQTSETDNMSWDLISGNVLETHTKSALGLRYKTVTVPAYSVAQYAELGSKAVNSAYKNMLLQEAATYTYRIDNFGNELGLVGASATTWNKEWSNYRKLTGGTTYSNSNELDENGNGSLDAAELAKKVWRIADKYTWKGNYSRLQTNGTHTFSPSDKFNFATPGSNTLWKKLNSHDRYSHTSQLMESRDINGAYSANKYGHNERFRTSSAANSKYEEFTFSGAEDRLSATSNFFGGEVALGSGTIVTTPVHTGKKALSLSSGYGFVFKSSSTAPESGILANKTYRASVWANSTNGRIYYKINGGAEVCPAPVISPAVTVPGGTWYRIDLTIPVGNVANPSIEVGVKSATGTVVFDDFRFQPADASVTAFVYNPLTLDLEYELDNSNVYKRYEYNNRGLLVRTYVELIKYGGEKLVSEEADNFRRFHIDQ